jgi:hypothetical protein
MEAHTVSGPSKLSTFRAALRLVVPLGLAITGCSTSLLDDDREPTGGEALLKHRGVMRRLEPGKAGGKGTIASFAPPGANLHLYGGRVVSAIRVVQVLYGGGSYLPELTSVTSPNMSTFYHRVMDSPYFDWLTEYNTTTGGPNGNQFIGRGTFVGRIQIAPSAANNGSTITDGNIQAELKAQINAGVLPAPVNDGFGDNNTYYAVFFPHGKTIISSGSETSCIQFCAYHSTIANINGHEAYYGVHPDMQSGSGCETGCGGGGPPFAYYQTVASHELVETVTDPDIGRTQTIGPLLGWYDAQYGEIGDICNAQQGTIVGNDGVTYTVQREFSNVANDCIVTRPPRGPTPLYRYFNGTQHFYTAFFGELGNGGAGYTLQGIAGYLYLDPALNAVPLYRYASLTVGGHFYTTFFGELGYGNSAWKFESIAGFVPTVGAANTGNFYRYLNTRNGDHYYTTNFGELGNGSGDYVSEGIQNLIFTSP